MMCPPFIDLRLFNAWTNYIKHIVRWRRMMQLFTYDTNMGGVLFAGEQTESGGDGGAGGDEAEQPVVIYSER